MGAGPRSHCTAPHLIVVFKGAAFAVRYRHEQHLILAPRLKPGHCPPPLDFFGFASLCLLFPAHNGLFGHNLTGGVSPCGGVRGGYDT